jgi:Ca-activated chloride channel homolog
MIIFSNKLKIFLLTVFLFFCGAASAQSLRSLVNNGVKLYNKGQTTDSEVKFKKGLEKAPNNFQANFDLGDAYYKEQKYDQAVKAYGSALTKTKNNFLKSEVYHNIGNALLKDKKYKESVGAYEQSLKLNPNDKDTKYNLSYALDMMKNKNNKQNQKNNKNDKNNKNNKNKQDQNQQNKQDQNKNKNQQNKQQQNNQQNQDKKEQQNQQKQNQAGQNEMSKAQAEQILNALKGNEKDIQKELHKVKGKQVKTQKDW